MTAQTVTADWTSKPTPPTCCRHGCTERAKRRVLLLDPDGVPQPLGHDEYCVPHATELTGMLANYGHGRPGYTIEELP